MGRDVELEPPRTHAPAHDPVVADVGAAPAPSVGARPPAPARRPARTAEPTASDRVYGAIHEADYQDALSAAAYAAYHQRAWFDAIRARLAATELPAPHPRLAWTAGSAGLAAALEPAMIAASGTGMDLAHALPELLYPVDVWRLIDLHRELASGRPGETIDGRLPTGPKPWSALVGAALAVELEGALRRSLPRMGLRYVAVADDIVHGVVEPAELVASAPIDRVVARLVCDRGVVTYRRPRRGEAHGDTRSATAFRDGLRVVRFDWQGGRDAKLWNWVRVIEPVGARAEEVSAAIFERLDGVNHTELAYALTAAPPYFRVPARWARSLDGAREHAPSWQAHEDDREGQSALALAESAAGDDAARAQITATRGPVDLAATSHALERSVALLELVEDQLANWKLWTRVLPAKRWIVAHQDALASAPHETQRVWAAIAAAQARVVLDATDRIVAVAELAAGARVVPGTPEASPFRDVLDAFAIALGESHLATTAAAQLAMARQLERQLPLALLELTLQANRVAAGELAAEPRPPVDSALPAVDHAALAIGTNHNLEAQVIALRARQVAGRGSVDVDELDTLATAAAAETLRSRIATLRSRIDQLEQAASAATESGTAQLANVFHGEIRALPAKLIAVASASRDIVLKMDQRSIPAELPSDPAAAPAAYRAARKDAVADAQRSFASLAERAQLDTLLQRAIDTIQSATLRALIFDIALLVGVTVVGAFAGGVVGGVVRGAVLAEASADAVALARTGTAARWLGAAANLGTDATVNAVGQTALFGGDTRLSLAENAIASVMTLAALRPIHTLAGELGALDRSAVGAWKALSYGKLAFVHAGALTAEMLVGAGASYVAARMLEGERPSEQVAQAWALQGASMAVGVFASRLASKQQARLAALGERAVHLWKRARAGEAHARALAKTGDPAAALRVLDDHTRLLEDEAALLHDDALIAKLRLDPHQLDLLRAGNAEALAEAHAQPLSVMKLRFHGLEPISGELWTGTREQIEAMLAASRPSRVRVDTAKARWTVALDGRELTLVEVATRDTHAVAASELAAQHARWSERGAHVSPLHYDAYTHAVEFTIDGGRGGRIRATLAPRIESAAQLASARYQNRVVGQPVDAPTGHAILRRFNHGDATAFAALGIDQATLPAGVELGLGEIADGRVVVVRGGDAHVDWSALPGLKPVAHTHPSIAGNDLPPTATGDRSVALAEVGRPTDVPLLPRELILPSAADFIVCAHEHVHEHVVYTPYVVDDANRVRKPAPGDASGPQLELRIREPREIGTLQDGRRVYHALVEATAERLRLRRDVWIVDDGHDGHLELAEPAGLVQPRPLSVVSATPPRELRARERELARVVRDQLGRGHDVELRVLDRDEFATRFRSDNGRAVFVLDGDRPVIYARVDATAAHVIAETYHALQLRDPAVEMAVRSVASDDFADWDRRSATDRIARVRHKLDVEIDAYQRMAHDGRGDRDTLGELVKLRDELDAISTARLARMNAGVETMPDFLRDPPRLFVKNKRRADRPATTVVPEDKLAVLDIAPIGDGRSSAFSKPGVRSVRQIGSEWTEHLEIKTGFAGVVTVRRGATGVDVVVTSTHGVEHVYTLEDGAVLAVAPGATVSKDTTIANEPKRSYRDVEVEYLDGRREQRREIRRKDGDGWIQRGSEATRRGEIAEHAARMQLDDELAHERAQATAHGEHFESVRVDHRRGGGGFDDVVIVFTGSKDKPVAKVRIREVKDYPDSYVNKADFTAIREGLAENLRGLEAMLDTARAAAEDGAKQTGFSRAMSSAEVEAARTAMQLRATEIEVVLGPRTRIGEEGAKGSSTLAELRAHVRAVVGPDVFMTTRGRPEHLEERWMEHARQQETKGTP